MRSLSNALALWTVSVFLVGIAQAAAPASFQFPLSDFSGTIPFSDVSLFTDRVNDEIYVGEGDRVRLFNPSGMETFSFLHDVRQGTVLGVTVNDAGEILILSYRPAGADEPGRNVVTRCDFRGISQGEIALHGAPPELAEGPYNWIRWSHGEIHLLSTSKLLYAVFDRSGGFVRGYDLAEVLQVPAEDRPTVELGGATLDRDGSLLATIPVFFKVVVVANDKSVKSFGKSGSGPGSFGVIAGVEVDDAGRIIVADRLRAVVSVFDANFKFVGEFGVRDRSFEGLVRPGQLAIGNEGRIYVTQLGRRGVAVFAATPP